jgi:hypothetical protein
VGQGLSHATLFLSRPLGQSKSLASKDLRGFVPLSHALGTGQVGQDRLSQPSDKRDRWDTRDEGRTPNGTGTSLSFAKGRQHDEQTQATNGPVNAWSAGGSSPRKAFIAAAKESRGVRARDGAGTMRPDTTSLLQS